MNRKRQFVYIPQYQILSRVLPSASAICHLAITTYNIASGLLVACFALLLVLLFFDLRSSKQLLSLRAEIKSTDNGIRNLESTLLRKFFSPPTANSSKSTWLCLGAQNIPSSTLRRASVRPRRSTYATAGFAKVLPLRRRAGTKRACHHACTQSSRALTDATVCTSVVATVEGPIRSTRST